MTDLQLMVMKLSFAPMSAITAIPPIKAKDLEFTEIHKKLVMRTGSDTIRNQLQAHTKDWECQIDLGSVGQFLSTDGFAPPTKDSFGGFTVFMFNPTPNTPSEEEMAVRLESLVQDSKASAAEWIKTLKRFKYYFPTTVDEAGHMMNCAIDFLTLLAGHPDCIATRGYTDALKAVKEHRQAFKVKQTEDDSFLPKILYLVETEQQHIYAELQGACLSHPDFPLTSLSHLVNQRSLRFQSMFPTMIGPFLMQIKLPPMLSTRFNAVHVPPSAPTPKKKVAPKTPPVERGVKLWWKEKPTNDSDNWNIPTDKIYSEYFNESDQGKSNQARIEGHQVGHHKDESNPRPLCPKYLAAGACATTCQNAHITRKRLQATYPALVPKIDAMFSSIYQSCYLATSPVVGDEHHRVIMPFPFSNHGSTFCTSPMPCSKPPPSATQYQPKYNPYHNPPPQIQPGPSHEPSPEPPPSATQYHPKYNPYHNPPPPIQPSPSYTHYHI
jgi:hypothetical protein